MDGRHFYIILYIIFNHSTAYGIHVYNIIMCSRVRVVTGPFVDWCRRWLSPCACVNDVIIHVGKAHIYIIYWIITSRYVSIMISWLLLVFYPQYFYIYLLYNTCLYIFYSTPVLFGILRPCHHLELSAVGSRLP